MSLNDTVETTPFSFNNTNGTENISNPINLHYEGGHVASKIANEILFAIICIVGLVGNTLVIYVIIRFSKMQTVTNMYIVNLAIADECFLIGIPFLMITLYKEKWIFGEFMCKTYMTLTSINQFTSSTFLCIMSADRYIAVCHPISSPKWRTPCISKIVSFLAWTWSIMLMIPIVIHTKEIEINNVTKSCQIFPNNNTTLDSEMKTFTIYNFGLGFATPLSLILIFYYLVIQKLKTVGPQNKSKEKKRSHRKVTKLVLTVVTVYIICWTPYWVVQLALIYAVDESEHENLLLIIHLVTSCLTYSNSAVNPILYAFLSDNFKKSFLKACTCAAGKDINATLHMENSVFPRKNKQGSSKFRSARGTSIVPNNGEDYEIGPLVSRFDPSTSAITMTSRVSSCAKETTPETKETNLKNGISINLQPTSL